MGLIVPDLRPSIVHNIIDATHHPITTDVSGFFAGSSENFK